MIRARPCCSRPTDWLSAATPRSTAGIAALADQALALAGEPVAAMGDALVRQAPESDDLALLLVRTGPGPAPGTASSHARETTQTRLTSPTPGRWSNRNRVGHADRQAS